MKKKEIGKISNKYFFFFNKIKDAILIISYLSKEGKLIAKKSK